MIFSAVPGAAAPQQGGSGGGGGAWLLRFCVVFAGGRAQGSGGPSCCARVGRREECRRHARRPKGPGKPRNPKSFDCCSVACWCERRVSRPSRTIPGSAHHRRTTNKKKKTTPTSSTLGLPLKHTRFDCKTNCVRCHPCFLVVRFDTYCERTRGCGGRWRRRHVEGVQHSATQNNAQSRTSMIVGDLWMWLQIMWLQFEVARGPVGAR